MKTLKQLFKEDLENLQWNGDEKSFTISILSDIDDKISSINTEIEIDPRSNKQTSKKLGVSQLMLDKDRTKYAPLVYEIIKSNPDLEPIKVGSSRQGKDYAFKYKEMDKYIYVNVRPMGKRSSAGDDPNELMTAALCLFPKKHKAENSDEMDGLIELVKGQLKKVKGYKQGQVDALTGDYPNMCQAVSAANSIIDAGYGGADMVYLTGQSWDDDVKQFKMSKYGMNDFNSSDFIVKKGDKFLGVSLKKKKSIKSTDPTLINKAFSTLFQDKKFDKMIQSLELRAGMFYLRVLASGKRKGLLSKDLLQDMKKKRPNTKNWKEFIQRVPNNLINAELKGSKSLFKDMAKIILSNKDMIGNQLVQLIFKSDLKELQKVNFDFALVTGIGDYGPKKGVVIEKGEYKDIDTVTTKLDSLFSSGKVDLKLDSNVKQAFDIGATAAVLQFDLRIGKTKICTISLRYKGNFRAAPSFLAVMHDDFKRIYK
tara:strand:+ start:255 stop:1700 length:1446 start_codon:yes stop_codon:yes gene_type:complete